MSCIIFVSFEVEKFNYPIDGFCFHIVKTDVLAMTLEHCRTLVDFCVVLWFCMLSQEIESFWLLHWSCDACQRFFNFIGLIKHLFDILVVFFYSNFIDFFSLQILVGMIGVGWAIVSNFMFINTGETAWFNLALWAGVLG
jgi:hypothetical protein